MLTEVAVLLLNDRILISLVNLSMQDLSVAISHTSSWPPKRGCFHFTINFTTAIDVDTLNELFRSLHKDGSNDTTSIVAYFGSKVSFLFVHFIVFNW